MKKLDRRRRALARLVHAFAFCIAVVGCGGATRSESCLDCSAGASNTGGVNGNTTSDTTIAKSNLPACTWSALLDADPGSRDHCHASRRSLECTLTNGNGEECTTDGEPKCPDATDATCKDYCAPDEYVVACGGVGPRPIPDPPSPCRFVFGVPAGVGFYCCPADPDARQRAGRYVAMTTPWEVVLLSTRNSSRRSSDSPNRRVPEPSTTG